ncbi:MAG: hypothetical protein ACKVIN_06910 [Longimicrobiales bacterium]
MRRQQVIDGTFGLLEERRCDAVWPGSNKNRLGTHRDAIRVGHAHPAVHLKQRHSLAVDGHLKLLLRRNTSEITASGRVLEGEMELILAVRQEIVGDRQASAGAIRRPLSSLPLGRVSWVRIRG